VRALAGRVRRLENRLAPKEDRVASQIATTLWERMRRRAEAQGIPFDVPPPTPWRPGGRVMSLGETLRQRRERARERNRAAQSE
jgi:hypothetical protein